MASSYQMFVKEHIHQFKHLPAKERMKAVAELYHKQKGGASEMPAKKGRGRPKKGGAMTAGSFLGDIVPFGNMLGLGLDEKGGAMTAGVLHKKIGRPSKRGGVLTAAGFHGKSPTMTGGGWFDDFSKGFMLPFQAIGQVAPALAHFV